MLSITKIEYILLKCTKVSDPVHSDNKGGNRLMLIAQMKQNEVIDLITNGRNLAMGIHLNEGNLDKVRISLVADVDK